MSERPGSPGVSARSSEPTIRIVCGSPGSISSSSSRSPGSAGGRLATVGRRSRQDDRDRRSRPKRRSGPSRSGTATRAPASSANSTSLRATPRPAGAHRHRRGRAGSERPRPDDRVLGGGGSGDGAAAGSGSASASGSSGSSGSVVVGVLLLGDGLLGRLVLDGLRRILGDGLRLGLAGAGGTGSSGTSSLWTPSAASSAALSSTGSSSAVLHSSVSLRRPASAGSAPATRRSRRRPSGPRGLGALAVVLGVGRRRRRRLARAVDLALDLGLDPGELLGQAEAALVLAVVGRRDVLVLVVDSRRARRSSQASVHRGGQRAGKVAERPAVGGERGHRDPLVGSVMAAADGAELDRGDADADEGDGVGGAVAADAGDLAAMVRGRRLAERPDEAATRRRSRPGRAGRWRPRRCRGSRGPARGSPRGPAQAGSGCRRRSRRYQALCSTHLRPGSVRG